MGCKNLVQLLASLNNSKQEPWISVKLSWSEKARASWLCKRTYAVCLCVHYSPYTCHHRVTCSGTPASFTFNIFHSLRTDILWWSKVNVVTQLLFPRTGVGRQHGHTHGAQRHVQEPRKVQYGRYSLGQAEPFLTMAAYHQPGPLWSEVGRTGYFLTKCRRTRPSYLGIAQFTLPAGTDSSLPWSCLQHEK